MPNYRYCDISLGSNIALPELPLSVDSRPEVSFRCVPVSKLSPDSTAWIDRHSLSDIDPFLVIEKQESAYLLRHFDLADFIINSQGTEIECRLQKALPEETIRHLLLDQIMPRLLSHQGRLMVHASAVLTSKGIIAFLGDTGWGKSTLAASLVQPGVSLMTDDCLCVTEIDGTLFGIPAYTGLRLLPDSLDRLYPESPELLEFAHYSEKKRLPVAHIKHDHAGQPLPLLALFVLIPPQDTEAVDEVSIEPISSVETLVALTKHSFKLDFTDKQHISNSFLKTGQMSQRIPAFSLNYPRKHSYLPAVGDAILNKVTQLADFER